MPGCHILNVKGIKKLVVRPKVDTMEEGDEEISFSIAPENWTFTR